MSEDANQIGVSQPEVSADLLRRLMRKQAGLSIRVASVFVALLIGLPLFNLYEPAAAATQEFGFTFSWLVLGVLFFPITWLLSAFYVARSNELETQITESEKKPQVSEETPS